jgi:hypothetical protein
MSVLRNKARYDAAAHAMQTGVAYEMNKGLRSSATEPKHLRGSHAIAWARRLRGICSTAKSGTSFRRRPNHEYAC